MMLLGILRKSHDGKHCIMLTLHRGDRVRLTLQSFTISPFCTKLIVGHTSSTRMVHTQSIASKHEDLVWCQAVNHRWDDTCRQCSRFKCKKVQTERNGACSDC